MGRSRQHEPQVSASAADMRAVLGKEADGAFDDQEFLVVPDAC